MGVSLTPSANTTTPAATPNAAQPLPLTALTPGTGTTPPATGDPTAAAPLPLASLGTGADSTTAPAATTDPTQAAPGATPASSSTPTAAAGGAASGTYDPSNPGAFNWAAYDASIGTPAQQSAAGGIGVQATDPNTGLTAQQSANPNGLNLNQVLTQQTGSAPTYLSGPTDGSVANSAGQLAPATPTNPIASPSATETSNLGATAPLTGAPTNELASTASGINGGGTTGIDLPASVGGTTPPTVSNPLTQPVNDETQTLPPAETSNILTNQAANTANINAVNNEGVTTGTGGTSSGTSGTSAPVTGGGTVAGSTLTNPLAGTGTSESDIANDVANLQSSSLAPTVTGTSTDLTDQTITPATPVDEEALAEQELNTYNQATNPAYQAAIEEANQAGASAGQLGSGQLRTAEGNLALQRTNQLQTAGQQFLENAQSTINTDYYNNLGVEQQQQGEQESAENQTFDQQLATQQASQAWQQGNEAEAISLLEAAYSNNSAGLATALAQLQTGGGTSGTNSLLGSIVTPSVSGSNNSSGQT